MNTHSNAYLQVMSVQNEQRTDDETSLKKKVLKIDFFTG